MKANRGVDTAPEVRLRSELHRRGFRFRKNFRIVLPDATVRPDIVFTQRRVAVFVDGCFWHGCSTHRTIPESNREFWQTKINRTRERDLEQKRALEQADWQVVRVWEHEPIEDAVGRVVELL